jgi:hypothetical protein
MSFHQFQPFAWERKRSLDPLRLRSPLANETRSLGRADRLNGSAELAMVDRLPMNGPRPSQNPTG